MSLTEKQAKKIASEITEKYDPENKTPAGYAKFARMDVPELGDLQISYKKGKGLYVEPMRFVKLDVSKVDKEMLQKIVDNLESLKLIAKQLE